jgi:type IV pilus assembly protein PilV
MISNRYTCRAQRGVGLVEVLVAMLVLSIGLLGLAGLQVRTLRGNQTAMQRGMAVIETHMIVDAMRADRDQATTGNFNLAMGAATPAEGSFRATALNRWRSNIQTALGADASGSVLCIATACTVIVRWAERGTSAEEWVELRTDVQL